MPNHLHGILWIVGPSGARPWGQDRWAARYCTTRVGTSGARPRPNAVRPYNTTA
jgi:hypothetical protein